MPYLTIVALLLAWAAWGQPAQAEEWTFRWVAPIEREDGSALPSTEISGYLFLCDTGENVALPPLPLVHTRDMPVGPHTCWLRAVTTDGQQSQRSNVQTFTAALDSQPPPVDPPPGPAKARPRAPAGVVATKGAT